MKLGLMFKGLFLIIIMAVIGVCLKFIFDNQLKEGKRAEYCRQRKPLIEIKEKKFDKNGVMKREGTFYRQVALKNKFVVSVVIFPQALNSETWSKVPQSSIKYLGKGGDGDSLREWLSPDYFYLLEVPENAKGLAFARLCYQNGDATVYSIKNWKQTASNKILINGNIHLEHTTPLPKINPVDILVNTGSNKKDSLGDVTEVYFTKEKIIIL
ncbi:hypothetical protein IQ247_05320 [Plectonema cf. radiosum LEGE 06105]|uniref:Uncharacterized protein n=1 Tax=Plectonema cf. radiosum LEGE 06105 TaxID=945769 RepID=A0A8J7JZL7_9CYAN|nr:hypothetical protein [Plectonema radiosum]MBE9212137.1 hypothetical protein [Plectonema cf. radiosum LEGE 06105]